MDFTKALKKKITGAVGKTLAAPYVKVKESQMRTDDKNYNFLKDYSAKKKRGTAVSEQDEARYQSLNK